MVLIYVHGGVCWEADGMHRKDFAFTIADR
jgi:hypothetical protein